MCFYFMRYAVLSCRIRRTLFLNCSHQTPASRKQDVLQSENAFLCRRYSLLSISPQSAFLECDNLFPDRMEKNICGKRILLFGNVTLLSYSLLSEVYGKMNIAMKGFLIRLPNMDLPATWNLRLFLKKKMKYITALSVMERLCRNIRFRFPHIHYKVRPYPSVHLFL